MDSDKRSTQVERLEVVDTGRRRRWSEDEKLRIVLESLQTPRQISATARRYGISRSLLIRWRRAFSGREVKGATRRFIPFIECIFVDAAQELDHRENTRLDQPQSMPRSRLRALRAIRRGVHPSRHDPLHAPTSDKPKSLLQKSFLDSLTIKEDYLFIFLASRAISRHVTRSV
jgi:transposase-like protein